MDILKAVAHKLRHDRELFNLLTKADAKAQITMSVLLTLDKPDVPKRAVSDEERTVFEKRMNDLVTQAEHGFAGIEGLEVYDLMKALGYASVGGTAEAVVRALELDCVQEGTIGDRPVFLGASVG